MIYILTNYNNVIISISEDLQIIENTYSIAGDTLRYPIEMIKTKAELETIPDEIVSEKYCYTTEQGFYKNPNYKINYSLEERIKAIEEALNTLLLDE